MSILQNNCFWGASRFHLCKFGTSRLKYNKFLTYSLIVVPLTGWVNEEASQIHSHETIQMGSVCFTWLLQELALALCNAMGASFGPFAKVARHCEETSCDTCTVTTKIFDLGKAQSEWCKLSVHSKVTHLGRPLVGHEESPGWLPSAQTLDNLPVSPEVH